MDIVVRSPREVIHNKEAGVERTAELSEPRFVTKKGGQSVGRNLRVREKKVRRPDEQ